jgi:hypothetical protein
MSPSTVFLISGETGENDELRTWLVATYADRALAEAHIARIYAVIGGPARPLPSWHVSRELVTRLQEAGLDASASIDNTTGTSYEITEMPLRTVVPGTLSTAPRGRLSSLAH